LRQQLCSAVHTARVSGQPEAAAVLSLGSILLKLPLLH
jgi:hypothetical protein